MAHDTRGVRTQLQEQSEADPAKTLAFSYDPSNQLTGETVTGGQTGEAYTSSYAYDSAGNRKSWQKDSTGTSQLTRYTNNNLNQTQSASLTQNGQRTTTGYAYDVAGNLSQATTENGSSDYAFDGANRLTSVVNRNAAGEAQSKTEFVYDGMSRLRVSKDFTWQKAGWVAVAEKRRVYDGMNVVQERDGTNERLAFYTRGLDMGGGIGGLLARSGDGVNLFYHYDGRGNVGQLTNEGGELAARYTYDAFGVLIASSGAAASVNAYRFSTKEAIGSLVYYGFRFYSPSLGKWINRDPIAEAGGVNLYEFVGNASVNSRDAWGLAQFGLSAFAPCGIGRGYHAQQWNLALGHEQLFFEDAQGGNTGFDNGGAWIGWWYGRQYVGANPADYTFDNIHYDDAIIRRAVATVGYKYRYNLFGNNCQTWADRVRDEYARLGGKTWEGFILPNPLAPSPALIEQNPFQQWLDDFENHLRDEMSYPVR